MSPRRPRAALAALLALAFGAPAAAAPQFPGPPPRVDGVVVSGSPFRCMAREGDRVVVEVTEGQRVELLRLGDVDTTTLLAEAERICGSSAWKRITEDLPGLMHAMGHPIGHSVDVRVRDLDGGGERTLPDVVLTGENRRRLWLANQGRPYAPSGHGLAGGPAISPFSAMERTAEGIEVEVADAGWFGLRSVAGVDTATLLREAEARCGDRAWKRLTEDLPALLDAIGHPVTTRVDLEVADLDTGAVRVLRDVAMTYDNRRALWRANQRRELTTYVALGLGGVSVLALAWLAVRWTRLRGAD